MSSVTKSYSYGEAAPDGLYTGDRAGTVQFYIEANIKKGLQYYTRMSRPLSNPLASGDSTNIYIKTGNKKMIVKIRIVHYIAEELELNIIENPTITNIGTEGFVANYNRVNPQTTTVEIRRDVSFTGGTPFDPEPEYYYGASNHPRRSAISIPEGREKVLPEDSGFLVNMTNTGSGNARIEYFIDWFEGEPDLPR